MQLDKYYPMQELQKMEKDFNKQLENGWVPTLSETAAMDLFRENSDVIAEVKLPHFKKEEVTVRTQDGMLEIAAEHEEKEEKKQKRHYYFRESSDHYFRRVTLPVGVQSDKAGATFKNGVLRVSIPIESTAEQKTVDIK